MQSSSSSDPSTADTVPPSYLSMTGSLLSDVEYFSDPTLRPFSAHGRRPSSLSRAKDMDETLEGAFSKPSPHRRRRLSCPALRVALIALGALGAMTAPSLLLFLYAPDTPRWVKVAIAAISGGVGVLSLPTWVVLLAWREKAVGVVDGVLEVPDVDICVTTYTESLDEIAGTVAAAQNVRYSGKVHVYILDDKDRGDVAEMCAGMRDGGFPVVHVTRESNKGKKGGNLNNYLSLPRTADFFVTLDCDMRPFPNMLQLLMSHFYSHDEATRRRIAFIQSPQFFRNYARKKDVFDICSMHFIQTILPCMDTLSLVPYIGTSALWRREALERAGGFVETHATEDVVTGCNVHQTDNPGGERYISKLLPVPIAAGLSPRTLPELLDQRTRWSVGLVQMAIYQRFFIFNTNLRPMQRLAYLATCGGWISYLLTYLLVLGGTLFSNLATAWFGAKGLVDNMAPMWCVGVLLSVLAQPALFLLLPGASVRSRLRGVQMGFIYTSTQLVGLLQVFGVRVSIRHASDSEGARWHSHFALHIATYLLVLASSAAAFVMQARAGARNVAPYLQVALLLATWTFVLWPIVLSLRGESADEDLMWLELEDGRVDLFEEPVFAGSDAAAFEQVKKLVLRLTQRVEEQDRFLAQHFCAPDLQSDAAAFGTEKSDSFDSRSAAVGL